MTATLPDRHHHPPPPPPPPPAPDLRDERDLSIVARLGCGAVAGSVGQTVAYPFDVARRRLQVSGWQVRRGGAGRGLGGFGGRGTQYERQLTARWLVVGAGAASGGGGRGGRGMPGAAPAAGQALRGCVALLVWRGLHRGHAHARHLL